MKSIYIILFSIVLLINCSHSVKKPCFSIKNPVEYDFLINIDSVQKIIIKTFSHKEFYGLSLASKKNKLITDIYDNPNNSNDFVLEEFSSWHLCKSKVYFNRKNEPHIYHATYQIHLEEISENKTKISIIVLESGIIYKTKLPVLPHLNRVNKIKRLPPTTVEEYEILLKIGRSLNYYNMPKIQIPAKFII